MEKDLKFNVGRVSSKASSGSFATSFEAAPQSPEEASRGTLLAVVAVAASPSFDAEDAARRVLQTLRESFYAQHSGGILLALEKAVLAAHQRLVTIVFSGGASEEAVDFDLSVGVLWGSVFYLAQLGNGKAVIRRGEKLRLIGHKKEAMGDLSAADNPDVRTASGLLVEGDVIVLGTPKFFENVTNEELERSLAVPLSEATKELREKVAEKSMAAALVMAIGVPALEGGVEKEDSLSVSEPDADRSEQGKTEELAKEELAEEEEVPSSGAVAGLAGRLKNFDKVKGRLDEYLSRTRGRLGPVGSEVGGRLGQARRRYGRSEYGRIFLGKVEQVWDKLGRPRTALEGVEQARNRRTLLTLAGALMAILLVGVLVNHMVKGSGVSRSRFDNLVGTAQGQYDEAQQAQSRDKSHAEELLGSASSNLKKAGSMHLDDKKVSDLQGKVSALQDSLGGVARVSPSVVVDLSVLRPGVQGAAMTGTGSSLYVLDGSGALYQIDPASKNGTVLSSDAALKHGAAVAQVGNSIFSYVPGVGIYGYDLKSKKTTLAVGSSANWGKIAGMAGFQNYLYLLDSDKNMIWRYTVSGSGLGSATTWLKSGGDLGSATSAAVDGSVWVGEKGTVAKFVLGKSVAFGMSEVSPALGQVRLLYVTEGTKNIYLVDSGRVVVVDKNGQVVGQYKSDKFDGASGLVVSEVSGKAYILAQSKVYEFDLK